MEATINAGVKVDFATPREVRDIVSGELASWRAELARGTRYRHPGSQAAASGAGALALGGGSDQLGPLEGFVWAVTRITVTGLGAAEVINGYINDTTPILGVGAFTATVNTIIYGQRGLILNSGDKLVFAGAGLTAARNYAVALEVTELPVQLSSRLL